MSLTSIVDACSSHAMKLGIFDTVNQHEPKSAPGNGVACAFWVDEIDPIPEASGLEATTARVALNVRIYMPMLQQPYDDIDPAIMEATSALLGEYSRSFTLSGLIRNVDLLGSHGDPLKARAGYLDQDKKLFRVMVITLPLVVNDLWTHTP